MKLGLNKIVGPMLVVAAALAVAAAPVLAAAGTFTAATSPVQTAAGYPGLNVTGSATLELQGLNLTAHISASGLSPNLPHLMHIHGVIGAHNDCPNMTADTNGDGFIDTAEGLPAYGPIDVTFSTRGDTSPAAALNLSTAVVADSAGHINYTRSFKVSKDVAKHLGDLHVVIHGADLNANGAYDGIDGSLGAGIPLEAELPVSCGGIN